MKRTKYINIKGMRETSYSGNSLDSYNTLELRVDVPKSLSITDINKLYDAKNIRIVYDIEEKVLTDDEKLYLKAIILPFRDRVSGITKEECCGSEFITIEIKNDSDIVMPDFEKDKYYKNMELDKTYTLEELGL